MPVEALSCNKCGAALHVEATTNFATCKYCNARLAIRRTESACFTELVDQVAKPLGQMANQLDKIAREQEVERLDRDWEREREGYLVKTKEGGRLVPSAGAGILVSVFMAGFGAFWTIVGLGITASMGGGDGGPEVCFPLFGLAIIVFGIASGVSSYNSAQAYQEAERRYLRRRREMLLEEGDEQL